MKLQRMRIKGFQSFGQAPTEISFADTTYLLGPNGAGKTAVMLALCRMFSVDLSLRRVRPSDFYRSKTGDSGPTDLWLEAEFSLSELRTSTTQAPPVPAHFLQMRLINADSIPTVRIRLSASVDDEGEIEESLCYVIEVDSFGNPTKTISVKKFDRNSIQLHYLPARRDPSDHISYSTTAILGRLVRAADWSGQREEISELSNQITKELSGNQAVAHLVSELSAKWKGLHKGSFFTNPTVTFGNDELSSLLKYLTVAFSPAPATSDFVDYTRLSDGQKSLLYISMAMMAQSLGRKVLARQIDGFDVTKLKPAVFTIVAVEEPENSLSPHYLGRVLTTLTAEAKNPDMQAILATHSPSILRRVSPENIRYLRLNPQRQTSVRSIILPPPGDAAHKFVREAVLAFPELYFSRLVVLGEGDSEEIVLPRIFAAAGIAADDSSVSVVPLGGRHVNHFWRLLHGLEIPFLTLLDLDVGRHQGGWGRIKYCVDNMMKFPPAGFDPSSVATQTFPKWDDPRHVLKDSFAGQWINYLEGQGIYFSSPLDLDFAMMEQFPDQYDVLDWALEPADAAAINSVLGKSHGDVGQYTNEQQQLFAEYHSRFKVGSKPSSHLAALSSLDDATLVSKLPASLKRLSTAVAAKLATLPE